MSVKTILKSFVLLSIFASLSFNAFAQNSENSQFSIYTSKQQQLRITAENVRLIPEKDTSKGGVH